MSGLVNTTYLRERIVTARKEHRCEGYRCSSRLIVAGERYLICTEYPGSDVGYANHAGHPVRLRICRECAPGKFEAASA